MDVHCRSQTLRTARRFQSDPANSAAPLQTRKPALEHSLPNAPEDNRHAPLRHRYTLLKY